ncbi:WD40 repeat-containing protein [Nitzschia inconspicua]|uniref:WD40 repeat-containing protein n=1 Tax=Nitzschia inconspicua TaxID=303405 RepID=A0A9K3LYA0_9STRA|nr:WD40 repeat-containing protein [Nitzschia inconspicua]
MSSFPTVDRLMDGEFTVEAADLIRIILGFLTSQGLHESARTLRKESGIGFTDNGMIHKRRVAQSIRQGDWGAVFQATVLLQEDEQDNYDSMILARIAEQVIMELAEEDTSLNLAYSLLKTHREVLDRIPEDEENDTDGNQDRKERKKKATLSSSNTLSKARSLEQRLAAIAGNPSKYSDITARQEVLYGKSLRKKERREILANMVEERRDIPLNRLPTLIQQAMKWQSHTGQLPWIREIYFDTENINETATNKKRRKRKRYNLVMGEIAGGDPSPVVGDEPSSNTNEDAEEEERESIPQDVLAKVKFGKTAVCESAVFFSRGLITGSSDSLIEIWDSGYKELNTTDFPYQKEHAMGHNDAAVLCMDVSNDGEILVSGDSTGRVKVWKLSNGKCLRQYQAHDDSVTALTLSRDASRILTGSSNGICREFGIVTQNVLQVYEGHTSYIHACRYVVHWNTGDSNKPQMTSGEVLVVTASADGTVRIWQHGMVKRILQPPRDLVAMKDGKLQSILVDPTEVVAECSGIHTLIPIPGDESRMLIVPRSSIAFLVDIEGTVLQIYQADNPETEFLSGTVTSCVTYLVSSNGDCLVYSLRRGTLLKTIRDFALDSTAKTNTEQRRAEISSMIHHPFKRSLIAAFSNDKTQKKGVLTVWK